MACFSSPTIHQLVHTLSYGDAISGEVLALQRVWRAMGKSSEIYALNVHPRYHDLAKKIGEFPKDFSGTIVLHYSLGSPLNQVYADLKNAHRALVYHNLTPQKWFQGVNPRIESDISKGLKELPELCALSDTLIADSEFNASELRALGYEAKVLNLPIDTEKWGIVASSEISSLVQREGGTHFLHVGRLAPNKCIEDIIRTFYFYHRYVDARSRLWLVGIEIDTELYAFGLKKLVHELALQDAITFTGPFTDHDVKALYQNCSAYLCMSEHEGFCLPVIEAMHFGLPVVSFASTALPDTVGNGGILVTEKRHAEIAELLHEVVTNSSLRNELIAAGKKRASELSLTGFTEKVHLLS